MAKTMEQNAESYLKLRDKRTALKKLYEEHDDAIKEKMSEIEGSILKYLNDQGMDSARTSAGTIYRQVNMTPSAEDWDTVYEYIRENDAFEMLERRIKKTFVSEYMEENEGKLPPGVKVYKEYVARVRRK